MLWKLLLLCAFTTYAFANHQPKPIVPEDVLTKDEITNITSSEDYFSYKTINSTLPVWMHTHRHYSKHFFDHRDHCYTYEDVLHRTITDSFPIQESFQELVRGRLGYHIQLGNIFPTGQLSFGEGIGSHGIDQIARGLFSFLLPANWMELANEIRIYKVSKLLLAKATLDQLLSAKITFVTQHQTIQDFEILNYYLVHLQLLMRKYPPFSRNVQTVMGKFATIGTDMTNKRSEIRLGFEFLALVMALAKVDKHQGTGHMNIADLKDFPEHVLDIDFHEDVYKHKHVYLEEVIKNSLELKIVREYYKISRLNIGISAFGTLETLDKEDHTSTKPRFELQFGYGNIPKILFARSLAKTARIDVQKEYIDMLSTARESFDYHLNSIGNYAESKRALELNRAAFKKNMEYLIETGSEPDAVFILALDQLIQAELHLNKALHLSLIAKAWMDRYLLKEQTEVFQALPDKGEIMKMFREIKGSKIEEIKREEEIAKIFESVRCHKELDQLLNHSSKHPVLKKLSDKELALAVQNSMGSLLFTRFNFHKRRTFFIILDEFVAKHKIQLTQMEAYLLRKNQTSWWKRKFSHKFKEETPVLHSFDFSQVGD